MLSKYNAVLMLKGNQLGSVLLRKPGFIKSNAQTCLKNLVACIATKGRGGKRKSLTNFGLGNLSPKMETSTTKDLCTPRLLGVHYGIEVRFNSNPPKL